eukprot:gene13632-28952_t
MTYSNNHSGNERHKFPGHCPICKGSYDENMMLICDFPGCDVEIHMYCLPTELFTIPEGTWYCPTCLPIGETSSLNTYINNHICCKKPFINVIEYDKWLLELKNSFHLNQWFTNHIHTTSLDLVSEFKGKDIIGRMIYLFLGSNMPSHTGRILNKREVNIGKIEYLIQFKSGCNDRNIPSLHWIILEEHSCLISDDFYWYIDTNSTSKRYLLQRFLQSSLFQINKFFSSKFHNKDFKLNLNLNLNLMQNIQNETFSYISPTNLLEFTLFESAQKTKIPLKKNGLNLQHIPK